MSFEAQSKISSKVPKFVGHILLVFSKKGRTLPDWTHNGRNSVGIPEENGYNRHADSHRASFWLGASARAYSVQPYCQWCNAKYILWLNDVFDIHRSEEAIERGAGGWRLQQRIKVFVRQLDLEEFETGANQKGMEHIKRLMWSPWRMNNIKSSLLSRPPLENENRILNKKILRTRSY